MIFVTVGSTWKFDDFIRYMDEYANRTSEKVVIQIGKSDYLPQYCEYFRFSNGLTDYYQKAELVISHGGAGTCFEVLKLGKKMIGVENKNAHDFHQWDLLNRLEADGYILWSREIPQLEGLIERARETEFKKYVSPECTIHSVIKDNLLAETSGLLGKTISNKKFLVFLGLLTLLTAIAFPMLYPMALVALGNETSSYILLIPAISITLLWIGGGAPTQQTGNNWPMLALAAFGIGSIYFSGLSPFPSTVKFQLIAIGYAIVIGALFAFVFGVESLKKNWFCFAFLVFMVPLPERVLDSIMVWMSESSADMTDIIFKIFQVSVFREGKTVFHFPTISIEVAKQCSGIRSTSVLFIIGVIASHLYLKSFWRKGLFLLLIFPIAILKNAVRIALLGYLGAYVNRGYIEGELHRNGGVLFFLLGLSIMGAVLYFLSLSESSKREKSH